MLRDISKPIAEAFERESVQLSVDDIHPLRAVTDAIKRTSKYISIVASIQEVGVIEPPVVARERSAPEKYILLDGHLRLEALKDIGVKQVVCLVSTEDEAFTYNRRINRLAIIQEHRMILKAIERGAPAGRIAKALNVNIETLNHKVRLLKGICEEAAELLKDKHVPMNTFTVLKKMGPMRQIEVAELMTAMNRYNKNYALSLLAATPQDQLVVTKDTKTVKGLTQEQMTLMEQETESLERAFKMAESAYSTDHLDLVLAKGYLSRLIGNAKIVRYLAQNHRDLLAEFQKIVEAERVAA
jgi:Predicted transcriptional regulators